MIMLQRIGRSESGATFIEFAIMLPLLMLLILGTIEIGVSVNAKAALSRSATDGVKVLASMPPGRLDAWSPATADAQRVPQYVGLQLNEISSSWSAVAEEFTQGRGLREIAAASGTDDCRLPDAPDLTALGLETGERAAILRVCLDHPALFSDGALGAHHFAEVRILPMNRPLPVSCRELASFGETRDGIYTIDPDATGPGDPFDALCDMTNGGWTMVAAQFEGSPEGDWSAGRAADYDPTLASSRSFALSQAEIPPHSATAFGLNGDATAIDSLSLTYATGNLDETASGASGASYDIYRNDALRYPAMDPESGTPVPAEVDYRSCLIVDRTGSTGFDWWFCPNATSAAERGAAFAGVDRRTIDDPSAAWTVWVR